MDSMMKVICLIVYLSAFSTTASSLSTVTVEDKRSNEVLIPLSQAPKTTMRILASPTAQPTTATIKNEGLAAYAMAASIPLLKNLAYVSPDKTNWAGNMSWSGDRRMLFDNEDTMERTIEKVADIVIQSLYTTQPPWCKFEGISCGTTIGTIAYASILNISLSDRNLNGTLPVNMKDFQSIETLDLGGNILRGKIPSIETWSSKLKILNLHGNRFTGKLPDGMEYAMTDLSIFSVQSNLLTGPIPFSLNYLSALSVLKLSYNSFDGNLSTLSIASPILNTLSLSGNTLSGTFPSTLTKMSSLQYLDVLGNYLYGTLPANIGAFGKLKSLDLSLNALSGTIPTSISKMRKLSNLDLHSNYFTMGTRKNIDASYFSNFTNNVDNTINLSENCLVFVNGMKSSQNANATRCKKPSFQPSSSPSYTPTFIPTMTPTVSQPPSSSPSTAPPSMTPSGPSFPPTVKPTAPTLEPTVKPSRPTYAPSGKPSKAPIVGTPKPSKSGSSSTPTSAPFAALGYMTTVLTVSGTNLPNSTSSQISTSFSTAFLSTVVSTLDISSDLISITSIRFSSKRRILSNINTENKNINEKNKILSIKSQESNKFENEKSFITNIKSNNINLASNIMIDEVGKTENVYFLLELGVEVTNNLISTLNTAVTSGQFARQFSSNYGDTVGFTGQFTQTTVTGDPVRETQSASNNNGLSRSGKIGVALAVIIIALCGVGIFFYCRTQRKKKGDFLFTEMQA